MLGQVCGKALNNGKCTTTNNRIRMIQILVVDNDDAVLNLVGATLRGAQYVVDMVTNGPEAIMRFLDRQYDLVVTDFEMPQMNGLELARAIRVSNRDVPIVLLTGLMPEDLPLPQITEAGVSRVLHKPIGIAELRGIRDALKLRKKS
jgi:CheY-like chemotaxis protein